MQVKSRSIVGRIKVSRKLRSKGRIRRRNSEQEIDIERAPKGLRIQKVFRKVLESFHGVKIVY